MVETIECEDGRRYEGEVNGDGQPHGRGIEVRPDGIRYEGDFRDGKPSGRGSVTCSEHAGGYEGEF